MRENPAVEKKETEWKTLKFTKVDPFQAIVAGVDGVRIKAANPLSPDQETKLREAICQALQVYATGDFKLYTAFRRLPMSTLDYSKINGFLTGYAKRNDFTFSDDSEQKLEQLWGIWNKTRLTEVSFDNFLIEVEQTNSANSSFTNIAMQYYPRGFSTFGERSPIRYSETPENILSSNREVIYATVCAVVKVKPADTLGIYFLFYWAPSSGQWLPCQLGIATLWLPGNMDSSQYSFCF
jgi:hypothetical protein